MAEEAHPQRSDARFTVCGVSQEDGCDDSTVVDASQTGRHLPHSYSHQAGRMNLVRLIPISDSSQSSLRMECIFRESGAFQLLGPKEMGGDPTTAPATLTTMDVILKQYGCRIVSIILDASSLQDCKPENGIAHPMDLPFSPGSVASENPSYLSDPPSHTLPLLSELVSLNIITSRSVSPRSLLYFLRFTPVLRTLCIHDDGDYPPTYPEDYGDLPTIDLPYLQYVTFKGLFSNVADGILSKLALKTSTRIEIHLGTTSPSWGATALRSTLSMIQHVCLSYTALGMEGGGEADRSWYLFSLSDIDSRVQVHWKWNVPYTDPPNLFHVRLDPAGLENVRSLTISLRNVTPNFHEWVTMLKPFPSLRHLDLHVTRSDTQDALTCEYSTATFRVRATRLLQKVMDVPLVFGLGLPGYVDPEKFASPGARPLIFGSSLLRKLYSGAWRHMVHKSGWTESSRRV
ncbi:hypothetical protein C8Q79DRAFT_917473 [Trametes meyenii]|nr:hypothetical protein C8Q79DRAFT_917473 [Trametes meyenii]